MNETGPIGHVLAGGRERLVAFSGIAILSIAAWIYTVSFAGSMGPMPVSMPGMQIWTATALIALWIMWVAMMVAMMLPSASPMVLTYAVMERNRNQEGAAGRTALFLAGYIAAWSAFCVVVTLMQWALHSVALLSPMMVSVSPQFSAAILMLAGIFQLSPIKFRCLSYCRSPFGFLVSEWRTGPTGAAKMGLLYGVYCVRCCWLLMSLLFAVGVMNLLWVAILSVFTLVERLLPFGEKASTAAGVILFLWGAWLLFCWQLSPT